MANKVQTNTIPEYERMNPSNLRRLVQQTQRSWNAKLSHSDKAANPTNGEFKFLSTRNRARIHRWLETQAAIFLLIDPICQKYPIRARLVVTDALTNRTIEKKKTELEMLLNFILLPILNTLENPPTSIALSGIHVSL